LLFMRVLVALIVTDSNNDTLTTKVLGLHAEVLTTVTPSNIHNNSNNSHDPNRAFIIVLLRSSVTLHCIDFLVP